VNDLKIKLLSKLIEDLNEIPELDAEHAAPMHGEESPEETGEEMPEQMASDGEAKMPLPDSEELAALKKKKPSGAL
jgi:hypothetical protein